MWTLILLVIQQAHLFIMQQADFEWENLYMWSEKYKWIYEENGSES